MEKFLRRDLRPLARFATYAASVPVLLKALEDLAALPPTVIIALSVVASLLCAFATVIVWCGRIPRTSMLADRLTPAVLYEPYSAGWRWGTTLCLIFLTCWTGWLLAAAAAPVNTRVVVRVDGAVSVNPFELEFAGDRSRTGAVNRADDDIEPQWDAEISLVHQGPAVIGRSVDVVRVGWEVLEFFESAPLDEAARQLARKVYTATELDIVMPWDVPCLRFASVIRDPDTAGGRRLVLEPGSPVTVRLRTPPFRLLEGNVLPDRLFAALRVVIELRSDPAGENTVAYSNNLLIIAHGRSQLLATSQLRRLTEPGEWERFNDRYPSSSLQLAQARLGEPTTEISQLGSAAGSRFVEELRGNLLPPDRRHDLHLLLGALAALDDPATWQQVLDASTHGTAWRRALAAAVLPRFRERRAEAIGRLRDLSVDADEDVRTEAHIGLLRLWDPATSIRWALASLGVGPNPVYEDASQSSPLRLKVELTEKPDRRRELAEYVLSESWRHLREGGATNAEGRLDGSAERIVRWLPGHLASHSDANPRLTELLGEARTLSRTPPE